MVRQSSHVLVPAGFCPQESHWGKITRKSGLKAERFFWEASTSKFCCVSNSMGFFLLFGKQNISCCTKTHVSLGLRFSMKSSLHWLQQQFWDWLQFFSPPVIFLYLTGCIWYWGSYKETMHKCWESIHKPVPQLMDLKVCCMISEIKLDFQCRNCIFILLCIMSKAH